MDRVSGKHINNEELNALVPSRSEAEYEELALSPEVVRECQNHLSTCPKCTSRVRKYSLLVNRPPVLTSAAAVSGIHCPESVDWYEMAAGLWPELKATRLMMHAALCDHCGPLLRAAARLDHDPTLQEENLLAQLRTPSRPDVRPRPGRSLPYLQFAKFLIPAMCLAVIAALLVSQPSSSSLREPFSGPQFVEFAAEAHRMHEQGSLALDIHADSQETVNEWLKEKSRLPLALPVSFEATDETNPYRLDGARLLQVQGKSAVLIAYQTQTTYLHLTDLRAGDVSLIVVRDSTATASGGVEANINKITFHYVNAGRYRVVTWSQRGLTYALVSEEGNGTQRSCMVCHAIMKDRDLSRIPTPLSTSGVPIELLSQ